MAVSLPVQSAICMVHKLFRVGVQVSCVHSLDQLFGRPYRLYQDRLFTNSPSDSWSRLSTHSRYLTTAAAAPSKTSVSSAPSNDSQLHRIVDEISNLTLLQAADLVTLLKVSSAVFTCNLPDLLTLLSVSSQYPGNCSTCRANFSRWLCLYCT